MYAGFLARDKDLGLRFFVNEPVQISGFYVDPSQPPKSPLWGGLGLPGLAHKYPDPKFAIDAPVMVTLDVSTAGMQQADEDAALKVADRVFGMMIGGSVGSSLTLTTHGLISRKGRLGDTTIVFSGDDVDLYRNLFREAVVVASRLLKEGL